jgi:hypothetical protein
MVSSFLPMRIIDSYMRMAGAHDGTGPVVDQ